MSIAESERLSVLSEAEQEALYRLPDFDDAQRLCLGANCATNTITAQSH